MKPLLSICVLTYNRPQLLLELLNSIFLLNKKWLNKIEVIVIDNGSTDDTWKTVHEFSDRRNFVSERFLENKRGSAGYLELIKRANGDFILFPGDDDVFKTEVLNDAIKFIFEFGDDYSLIAFGADTIDENGKSNFFSYRPPNKYSKGRIAAKLLIDSVFWMPCTMIKTSILKNKSVSFTLTSFDWWIWINGFINGEIKYFNSDLISYRQHDGQEQRSYLKLNWEVDSLLMLNNELDSDFGKYLKFLLENETDFLSQLKIELQNVKFDEFQIIKWSLILTKLSRMSESINLLKSIGNPAKIWNDLRFVEAWFSQSLSIEEILKFFEFWGTEVKVSNLYDGEIYLNKIDKHEINYEKEAVLRLYTKKDLHDFQFILVFQRESEILKFVGSSELVLKSNLKSIFGLTVKKYRKVETFNQITPFETKILNIVRLLKRSKFANLIKSSR